MTARWTGDVLLYAAMAKEHGVYPDGGCLLDQTAWFHEACEIVWKMQADAMPKPGKE